MQANDVVVVSAAAGAVGSCACQIAKNCGARVIGIAGGSEKCQFLIDEIGCDDAIDYKNEDIDERLKALAPDGLDVFFDNVGGAVLPEALRPLAAQAVASRARLHTSGGRFLSCRATSTRRGRALPFDSPNRMSTQIGCPATPGLGGGCIQSEIEADTVYNTHLGNGRCHQ